MIKIETKEEYEKYFNIYQDAMKTNDYNVLYDAELKAALIMYEQENCDHHHSHLVAITPFQSKCMKCKKLISF